MTRTILTTRRPQTDVLRVPVGGSTVLAAAAGCGMQFGRSAGDAITKAAPDVGAGFAGTPPDLLGMAAIGGFLAVDLGAVAYAGGWIGTAHRLTPHIFIKAFEWVNGKQSGFRKNHAKGVAVAGYFDSNGNGREVSSAAVFRSGRTPVFGHSRWRGATRTPPIWQRRHGASAWRSGFLGARNGAPRC